MFKKIILIVILVFFSLMLVGCTKTTTIHTNQYYQTDYNYFCLEEGKTWSQIVVCLTAEGKAERTQNKVTNELLDEA